MHPVLFEIFGEPFPSYFGALLLGFVVCTWLSARLGEARGIERSIMYDIGFFSLVLALIGSRLFHVLFDGFFLDYVNLCLAPEKVVWPFDASRCAAEGGRYDLVAGTCHPAERDCFAWANLFSGGLTYYGGLFLAAPFALDYLKRRGVPALRGIDTIAFALPLGVAFGRLGCFLAGCCFGAPFDGGIVFPPYSPASEAQAYEGLIPGWESPSLPVHPTQLYELLGCLAIFAYLMLYRFQRVRFEGQVSLESVGLYAVLRFILEFFRADARGEYFGLSTSQWLGLLLIVGGVYFYRKLRAAGEDHQAPGSSPQRRGENEKSEVENA